MPISYFDLALLIIIGGFGLFGLFMGLINVIGSLTGMLLGLYLASRYYEVAANWLIKTTGWGDNFSKVLMFVIAFFIINRLVGLIFWFLEKIFGLVTHLPFMNSINRFLGMIFGLLEGVFAIGIVFYFFSKFPFGDTFMTWVATSKVIPQCVHIASILWPLIPVALKTLEVKLPIIK